MDEARESQTSRMIIRARFLNIISRLAGKNCSIEMYEQATISCKMVASDSTFENIIVTDLMTPANVILDKAIIRTGDIISVHFFVDDNLKLDNQ